MKEKIVKEMVRLRIRTMFLNFVNKHIESVEASNEKNALVKLINNDDEWSAQILENLWSQFEKDELTDERMTEMSKEALIIIEKQ